MKTLDEMLAEQEAAAGVTAPPPQPGAAAPPPGPPVDAGVQGFTLDDMLAAQQGGPQQTASGPAPAAPPEPPPPEPGQGLKDALTAIKQGTVEFLKGQANSQQAARDTALGAADLGLSLASGAVAEPAAGLAGAASAVARSPVLRAAAGAVPGVGPALETALGAAQNQIPNPGETVEAVRDAITVEPQTDIGQRGMENIGKTVNAAADLLPGDSGQKMLHAGELLGDAAYEWSGSPAIAAMAKTLPTAILEVMGLSGGKFAISSAERAALRDIEREFLTTRQGGANALTRDKVKGASDQIYDELNQMNVRMRPKMFRHLAAKLRSQLNNTGYDPKLNPNTEVVLKRLAELEGDATYGIVGIPIMEIRNLREMAANAARSGKGGDIEFGYKLRNTVDTLLDQAGQVAYSAPEGVNIGPRLRVARELWGREKRMETLEDIARKAELAGRDGGPKAEDQVIRREIRSILTQKDKRQYWSKNELKVMDNIITAKTRIPIGRDTLGRFGYQLGGTLGGAKAAGWTGVAAAQTYNVVNWIQAKLGRLSTARRLELADEVVRAGRNGDEVVKAYLRHVPKNMRNPDDLADFLARADVSLPMMQNMPPLVQQASKLLSQRQGALAGATGAGALSTVPVPPVQPSGSTPLPTDALMGPEEEQEYY